MSVESGQRSRLSGVELARQWSTSALILLLLALARRSNAVALKANRGGRRSGWIGLGSRALTSLSTRLYEAESARRGAL